MDRPMAVKRVSKMTSRMAYLIGLKKDWTMVLPMEAKMDKKKDPAMAAMMVSTKAYEMAAKTAVMIGHLMASTTALMKVHLIVSLIE